MKGRRVGIVGAGNISKLHLGGMARHADGCIAAAITDPDEQALVNRARDYAVEETYPTLDAMIANAALDAAIVCTPTHVRSSVVIPLLEADIPVLCEKPLGETLEEAEEMAEASARTDTPLAVNQNFRRHFSFAMAREVIASGAVGKPLHLTQISTMLRHDAGWRLDRKRYVMAVMSIHWFDGYRWLFDAEPTTVYCSGVNSPATEGGGDTGVSVVLTFPGGIVASLTESFSSFKRMSYCCLDCEKASLEMSMAQLRIVRGQDDVEIRENSYDKAEATYHVLDDLLRATEEGREPETSAADNIKSMRIMEAAYRSLETGEPVRLEEVVL